MRSFTPSSLLSHVPLASVTSVSASGATGGVTFSVSDLELAAGGGATEDEGGADAEGGGAELAAIEADGTCLGRVSM